VTQTRQASDYGVVLLRQGLPLKPTGPAKREGETARQMGVESDEFYAK
jgi:hypothetical protein